MLTSRIYSRVWAKDYRVVRESAIIVHKKHIGFRTLYATVCNIDERYVAS